MKAVWLEQGTCSVRDVPEPADGLVRLRMRLAGICNTDLELQRGYYGFAGIPGHEFVAEEVESGRRVVGEINLACGRCRYCERGLGRHCVYRKVLGIVNHPGAFAEYLSLPAANLLEVPAHVSDAEAVFTEPLAAACEILEQVTIPVGADVAVLGDGKLGLLIAQVLAVHGARVVQYGRHKRNVAIGAPLGVTGVVQTGPAPQFAYPYVVEATGTPQGLQDAITMVTPRGTVIMKSTVASKVEVDMAPAIVNEITLVGSRCGRFAPALELIASGKLNLGPMMEETYALQHAPIAFARAAVRGTLKVFLAP